jgi:hypothetical protein
MCISVHRQSFLRRQCPSLVLLGVVFSIEATDASPLKALTPLFGPTCGLATCLELFGDSICSTIVLFLLCVPLGPVLIFGFGHCGEHGSMVFRHDTPVMDQYPARVT